MGRGRNISVAEAICAIRCQRRLARAGAAACQRQHAPREIDYRQGDARAALADAEPADLVIASYVIGEMDEAEQRTLAELMWSKTRDTLLVVEPGTPAGYARIIALRAQLVASGAHVAAPCPHDGNVRCASRTGVISPSACRARRRTNRSRAPSCRSRTRIQLSGADPRAGRGAARPGAGATCRQQGRGHGKTLHARRRHHGPGAPPQPGSLCPRPPLALGGRGGLAPLN